MLEGADWSVRPVGGLAGEILGALPSPNQTGSPKMETAIRVESAVTILVNASYNLHA